MNSSKTPFFGSSRRTWLLVGLLVVLSLLVAITSLAWLHTYGQGTPLTTSANTGAQSFSVGPDALLSIKEQGGDISVFPSNTSTITVIPRNHGTTLAPDPQHVHLIYNQTLNAQGNNQISVTTDPWFSNIDFLVKIPSTTAVQIALNSGSIDVHAGNGLSANTSSGSIYLENIQGATSAHTDSGDVTASNIIGPLTISSSSGSLRMQQIKGQVNAKTWSGDVIANGTALSGNSLLQTQNGSVRFAGSIASNGAYTMNTTSGDVDLTLPDNVAFALEASTGSGTVQNAFGNTIVGAMPRAQLSLHTQNGSIAIVKAS